MSNQENTKSKQRNELNLYDYYFIRFGYRPPAALITKFKGITHKDKIWKQCKCNIDAAVTFIETMDGPLFDKKIIQISTDTINLLIDEN